MDAKANISGSAPPVAFFFVTDFKKKHLLKLPVDNFRLISNTIGVSYSKKIYRAIYPYDQNHKIIA